MQTCSNQELILQPIFAPSIEAFVIIWELKNVLASEIQSHTKDQVTTSFQLSTHAIISYQLYLSQCKTLHLTMVQFQFSEHSCYQTAETVWPSVNYCN